MLLPNRTFGFRRHGATVRVATPEDTLDLDEAMTSIFFAGIEAEGRSQWVTAAAATTSGEVSTADVEEAIDSLLEAEVLLDDGAVVDGAPKGTA